MTETKKDGFMMYSKECKDWLDSSQFSTSESLTCKNCQLDRIKEIIKNKI